MEHSFIDGACAFCGAEEPASQICIDESPRDVTTAIINAVKLTLIEHGYASSVAPWSMAARVAAAAVLHDLSAARDGRRLTITSSATEDFVVLGSRESRDVAGVIGELIHSAPERGTTIRIEVGPETPDIVDVVDDALSRSLRSTGMLSPSYQTRETARRVVGRLKNWRRRGTL